MQGWLPWDPAGDCGTPGVGVGEPGVCLYPSLLYSFLQTISSSIKNQWSLNVSWSHCQEPS